MTSLPRVAIVNSMTNHTDYIFYNQSEVPQPGLGSNYVVPYNGVMLLNFKINVIVIGYSY